MLAYMNVLGLLHDTYNTTGRYFPSLTVHQARRKAETWKMVEKRGIAIQNKI